MPVLAVVGGQWGDEGKGKIIDLLAGRAHVVVRAQGGDNAGHTVVNPRGKFALHLVPAGIFNEQTRCLIGPGVALNPETLLAEMDELARRGVSTDNLVISARAHLVMPYHPLFDKLEEEARGAGAIGTTGRGIGPTYSDKVGRVGIVAGDLLHPERFRQKVKASVERKNLVLDRLYGAPPVDADEIIDKYLGHADRLGKYIAESEPILEQALKEGRTILLEGGHGTLLDLDHGTYPYVTTTSCTVGGLLNGAGIGPRHLTTAIGVFKAYQSQRRRRRDALRAARRHRRSHPRARPRVRHHHRPAAPRRLVRRRRRPPLDDRQRLPLDRADPHRHPGRPRRASSLRRLRARRRAGRPRAEPDRGPRALPAGLRGDVRLEGADRRRPELARICPARPRTTSA